MGRKLKGIAAAPGIAIAPVVHFHTTLDQIPTRKVADDELDAEKGRLVGAIEAVAESLTDLQKELAGAVGRQDVRIYDAQLAILHDQTFVKEVEGEIDEHKCNLEVALQRVVARYESVFEQMENAAMRERAADLRDIGRQLVSALSRPDCRSTPPTARTTCSRRTSSCPATLGSWTASTSAAS